MKRVPSSPRANMKPEALVNYRFNCRMRKPGTEDRCRRARNCFGKLRSPQKGPHIRLASLVLIVDKRERLVLKSASIIGALSASSEQYMNALYACCFSVSLVEYHNAPVRKTD